MSARGHATVRSAVVGAVVPLRVGDPDRAVADLAGLQQGVVSRTQLLAAGLTPDMIRRRRARGGLHDLDPPVRGVYLVGHAVAPPLARERAALLACGGDQAIVSHRSAAALWGIEASAPGPVDVTVVGPRAPRRPGVRGHCVATIGPREWRWHEGVPLTSPARTVLDVAATVSLDDLEAIVDRGRIAGLLRDGDLRRTVDAARGRRGVSNLRALLDAEQAPGFSRSIAERLAMKAIQAAQLPRPSGRNLRTKGRELDLVWDRERVVLEVDGQAFHRTARRFEDDRAKDGALHASGYRVLRVTWRMLTRQPEVVVARLAAVLALAERDLALEERVRRPSS